MEKGFCRAICGCMAALLLCGCGKDAPAPIPSGTSQTSTTEQTTSEPSITIPPVTEPTITEPTVTEPPTTQPPETAPPAITEPPLTVEPPVLAPVTKIKSTKWKTFPDILSLGGGILITSRNHFDPDRGRYINTMERVDIYQDAVLTTLNSDTTRELVCQRFDDGAILSADPASKTFYIYSGDLQLQGTFTAPNIEGYFSYDRQYYYYLTDGVLYRMEVATGNRGRMRLEHDLRFESLVGIHPTEDMVVARVYLSEYTFNCGIAVVDLTTGKIRLLSDRLAMVWLTGDWFYGVAMDDEVFGYDLYMGQLSTGQVQYVAAAQLGGDVYGYNVLPGSHLLLRRKAPDEGTRYTTIYDMAAGGTMVEMEDYDFVDATFGAVFLYEEQLIFGFYEDGAWFKPILIDTRALTFGEGLTAQSVEWELVEQDVLDTYRLSSQGPQLEQTYDQLRQKADQMEQTYGVTIQFATQVELPCHHAGYSVTLVEDVEKIQVALDSLDAALGRYPAGLLEQFQNNAWEGGLQFCLTGSIEGKIPTVGFAKLVKERYVLGLDITAAGLEKTIHHEIWHAMEMKISTDTFNTADWAACNPADFKYYGKYDGGYQDLTGWTWTSGSGSQSCFVDSYARINGREDRARIWEYIMATDATDLMAATALKQKLAIMVAALEREFDFSGQTPWGRYL